MLKTERLCLRNWREEDRDSFAALNADPVVMEYFPSCLTRSDSDAMLDRLRGQIDERGWGMFAAELRDQSRFIGMLGLLEPRFQAHFTPCVEIGWRFARDAWGRGLATEGATAALRYAFDVLGMVEIVSFTTEKNARSRRVMEKLGMMRDPAEDFDHPALAADHPLRRHVLYRVTNHPVS